MRAQVLVRVIWAQAVDLAPRIMDRIPMDQATARVGVAMILVIKAAVPMILAIIAAVIAVMILRATTAAEVAATGGAGVICRN